MTVEKPDPKQLLRPITTGADSEMNQSQFLAITCNSLEAREKSRVHGVIGFGFASHWLKNWRESFKPITKRSNRNHVITFDSHLKTALMAAKHQPITADEYVNHANDGTWSNPTRPPPGETTRTLALINKYSFARFSSYRHRQLIFFVTYRTDRYIFLIFICHLIGISKLASLWIHVDKR